MRVIAGLRLFTVAGILSLSFAGAANAADITKFRAEGNLATSNSNDGTYDLALAVVEDDTNSSEPVTNLFFNRSACDANGCSGTFGFGTIPSSDFNASSHHAKLNTNLAAVAGFQEFSFSIDFNTGESTQTAITPTGVIMMDWTQVPNNSTKTTGTTTVKTATLSIRSTGTSFTTRAKVRGSFVGSPITDSNGNLGSSRQGNMTIIRD
jgi:hypothetical protein